MYYIYGLLLIFFFFKLFLNFIYNQLNSYYESYNFHFNPVLINFLELEFSLNNDDFFSNVLFLLVLIVGFICTEMLNKQSTQNVLIKLILITFIFLTFILVSTTNLLILVLSFECIFLPTIYKVYTLNYTIKSTNSIKNMIKWTFFGALLVLGCLLYIYDSYDSLDIEYLKLETYTKLEVFCIYYVLFIGFGVKIPLVPFQFWLLKIHVDSPSGLSMFLSGFLVKLALYCFYIFSLIFQNSKIQYIESFWIFISLFVASISLISQQDLKKLIAWMTIQEMTTIMLLLSFRDNNFSQLISFFIFFHGILSTYMFYLLEIIEKRFKTREINIISGLSRIPKFNLYIWILIFLFCSLPFTLKFFIEWEIYRILIEFNNYFLIINFLILSLFAIIGVCKIFFNVLYGECQKLQIIDITTKEQKVLNFLLYCLVFTIILAIIVL